MAKKPIIWISVSVHQNQYGHHVMIDRDGSEKAKSYDAKAYVDPGQAARRLNRGMRLQQALYRRWYQSQKQE